ncbi:Ig-like domain-containing protein [Adhaeribacter swui]|uniref:Ig-like domain-containing protein n=1 Tax=Adhaeribacter swui TaxID=2086471 RepID=UPI00162337A3|nr:T9SS type A sorting domain-containing protein [Adhaeribacter swui]
MANLQAGTCTTTAPSSIALESGSKTLLITSAYAGLTTSTLKIYRDGVVFTGTVAPVSTTSPYTYRFTPSNSCTQFAFSYDCSSTGKGSGASSYVTLSATATVNGCESPRSTQYYLTGNTLNPTPNATTTATPTISTSNICPSTITITGTSVANALIYLFSNGQSVRSDANGGIISVATANGNGVWSIDMSLYGFTLNDVVTVKAKEPGDPATYSSGFKGLSAPSNGVTIGSTCGVPSMAPAITGNYCTSTSIISVTGTSSEAAGTTITIYKTGVSTALATATVSSAGYWTATIPANQLTGGSTFYATATAPNKTVSSNSTTTSVSSKPSGSAITINAVTEGATSITGFITGTVTNPSTIRIYIDGTPISQTATVAAAGNWTVSGIPASEVAAGLRVTATIAANANTGCLESDPSTAVTISCTPPSTTIPSTTLTSANTFCSNGAAKISVANSENGVVYEMYNVNTNMVSGSSVLGTGGTIILTSADLTSSATLTVRAYKIGASCGNVTIANSTYSITVNFPPTVFNVSPSTQSTCNGGTATLTLSGSQSGVNYQLYNGSTPTGNQVTGNGGILTLISGPLTTNATLTVRAIAPSACSDVTMNGSSTVTLFTPPSVFNVTPLSQTICTGGTVQLSLSGSQSGIKYQIYNGTTPSGAQVTGTGNAITLTSETLSSTSTLTVRAIDPNGCNNVAMNGSATITVNIPPTKFDLTPSSLTICKGGTAQLSLSGSQSGVQYQIYDGSTATGNSVTGTGNAITITSGNLNTSTTLTVQATAPTGCTNVTMAGSTVVTVNNPPNVFSITSGNKTICSGGTAQITISGSQSGIQYQIFNGSTPTGNPVNGTGNAITLNSAALSASTTLTVQAIALAGCSNVTMTGSAVITVNSPPIAYNVLTSNLTICSSSSATINIANSQSGVQYQIFNGSSPTGSAVLSSGGAINLISGPLTANTTLTVQAIAPGGCNNVTMNGSTAVTVNKPASLFNISPNNQTICSGSTAQLTLTGSQSGVQYQIFNGTTPTGNPVNGTGNSITLTSGSLSENTSLTVQAVGPTGCSNVTMSGTSIITVIKPVVPTISSTPASFCGSGSTVISVTNPQTNYTYQLFRNNSTTPEVTWGTYNGSGLLDFYVNLNQNASFTVKAFIGTCAVVTSNSVSLAVTNCAINYTVSPAYARSEYVFKEIIATPKLQNGKQYTFTGTNFLPGTSVDLTTGKIYVSDLSTLTSGTRTVNITATEAGTGIITEIPVTYSVSPDGNPTAATRFNPPVVLPVSLLYFKGTLQNGKVHLTWATATERNNQYFVVERSLDAITFNHIGQVEGAGNSNALLTYSFEDTYATTSAIYYRLKQVDFDGKFKYSQIIVLNSHGGAKVEKVFAYPNPTQKDVRIYVPEKLNFKTTIQIWDVAGQLIKTESRNDVAGRQYIDLDLQSFAVGTYIVSIQTGSENFILRIIRQ